VQYSSSAEKPKSVTAFSHCSSTCLYPKFTPPHAAAKFSAGEEEGYFLFCPEHDTPSRAKSFLMLLAFVEAPRLARPSHHSLPENAAQPCASVKVVMRHQPRYSKHGKAKAAPCPAA